MKEICKYTMYHRNQGQIKDSHKAGDHSAEGLRAQPNKRLDTFFMVPLPYMLLCKGEGLTK